MFCYRSGKCELKLSSLSATLLKNYISTCDEPMILLNVSTEVKTSIACSLG